MSKKVLIIVGVAVVAVLIGAIFLLSGSGPGGKSVKLPDHEFEDWNQPISDQAALTNEALTLFDTANLLTYEKLMEMVRTGRISLVSELWRLRRSCPKDMKRYDCNIRIRQFILSQYKPPGNERLAELLVKYLRYEEIMSTYQIDEKDPVKRYELIKKKRRELFGSEDAALVFGFQEAQYDFRNRMKSFMASTKDMPGDKRMERYEALRKEAYGNYYDAVVDREPKFTTYDVELTLRENDLKALEGEKRTTAVRELREKYFGKAGAERMAKVDQQIAKEQGAEQGYRAAEKSLLSENPNLSAAEKEAKLAELRKKYFGDQGAEEFARREKYRLYLESQKKQ